MTRKLFFLLTLTGFGFGTNEARATIHTVSNASTSIAQYTNIATAITASAPGDTIYVMATGISYGAVSVNKSVVLIGSGAWPEAGGGMPTRTSHLIFSNAAASGAVIKGFDLGVTAGASVVFNANVSNVIIEMNRLQGPIQLTGAGNNIVVRNNLFSVLMFISSTVGIFQNGWIISNNVIHGSLGSFGVSSSVQNIFLNNVIYRSGTSNNPLSGLNNTLIANNIIVGGGDTGVGDVIACQINNNCFFGNYTEAGILGTGSAMSNNLVGPTSDPMFVSATNFNATLFSYAPVAPFVDLHLQPGSPCIGSGQLGADMGIYDGGFPWMDNTVDNGKRTYYPGPRIPEMLEIYSTGFAQPNNTLDVNIKGKHVN
jgi:hypothetical protein